MLPQAAILIFFLGLVVAAPKEVRPEPKTEPAELILRLAVRIQKTADGPRLVFNLEESPDSTTAVRVSKPRPVISVATNLAAREEKESNDTTTSIRRIFYENDSPTEIIESRDQNKYTGSQESKITTKTSEQYIFKSYDEHEKQFSERREPNSTPIPQQRKIFHKTTNQYLTKFDDTNENESVKTQKINIAELLHPSRDSLKAITDAEKSVLEYLLNRTKTLLEGDNDKSTITTTTASTTIKPIRVTTTERIMPTSRKTIISGFKTTTEPPQKLEFKISLGSSSSNINRSTPKRPKTTTTTTTERYTSASTAVETSTLQTTTSTVSKVKDGDRTTTEEDSNIVPTEVDIQGNIASEEDYDSNEFPFSLWDVNKAVADQGFGVLSSRCASFGPGLVSDGAGGCTKPTNRAKKKHQSLSFRSAAENELQGDLKDSDSDNIEVININSA